MRSNIPQINASDEKEVTLPVFISPEELPDGDEPGPSDIALTERLPGSSESAEMVHGPIEPSAADRDTRQGMRVMRTSPVILISCGLVFVSLIFLLDYVTQTGVRADQTIDRRATSNSQANSQRVPAGLPEQTAQTSVPVAQPAPSVEPDRVAPASAEPVVVVAKED